MPEQSTLQLRQKFIDGLAKYNLTYDDVKNNFRYYGGDTGRHRNYLSICHTYKLPLPSHAKKCVCDHNIVENCYITDDKQILVIGNCCIKKFITKSSRTCERCHASHNNRIVNRCNDCRKGRCDTCDKPCSETYKKCWKCQFS